MQIVEYLLTERERESAYVRTYNVGKLRRVVTKVGEKRQIRGSGEKERPRVYRGVFEACCCRESSRWGSGALRLTVSYLKYIFVDGTFIDVTENTPAGTCRDNISPVPRKEASFPVTSPMKKPASQSQPEPSPHGLLRLTAYLRLASCLSTPGWMCIGIEYRQTASLFLFPPS